MKRLFCVILTAVILMSLTGCRDAELKVKKEIIDSYTSQSEADPETEPLPLEGKTVVCLGDSLFGMYRDQTASTKPIADLTGAAVYNAGFGGSRISYHPYSGYDAFSGFRLADAVATGDWSLQQAQIADGEEYFEDQLNILMGIDFSEVDIIVLHYGTNDFNSKYIPLSNSSDPDDTNTVCGALRYTIKKLKEACPDSEIVVSLPVYRVWTSPDGESVYAEDREDSFGNTLYDLCEEMKKASEENSVTYIDNLAELGIKQSNARDFLEDGTHLNKEGRKLFGETIADHLIENFSEN